ncbi:MAG TPA: hypothetical protein VG294_13810 [Solirubrobacteraceae bacterium]|jgi:hypothetical protein|nr:hypothetical protein [Solirubrobacteraceae bacterium]
MSRASARWGVITFAVIAVLGLVGLLSAAANDKRTVAFSLDIPPVSEVTILSPQESACEGPLETQAAFGGIQIFLIPGAVPGAAFELTVRDSGSGALLATGHLAPGYTTRIAPRIILDSAVPAGRSVEVCLHNQGPTRAAPIGGPGNLVERVQGQIVPLDVTLTFLRRHPRSLLSLLPTAFDRAALFHPRLVGAWTFWLLTGALLVAFALGVVALARAAHGDGDDSEEANQPLRP